MFPTALRAARIRQGEYMTIVPLVLAGLIFIGDFSCCSRKKRGSYGGGVMVISSPSFLLMTLAGSFGLASFFQVIKERLNSTAQDEWFF